MLENESVTRCLQTLTNMQLNCLCPQLLKNERACSDFFCFRNQMNSGPLDPVVQPRLKECPLLSKLLSEPHSNQCESQQISYAVAQEASWTFAKLTAPSSNFLNSGLGAAEGTEKHSPAAYYLAQPIPQLTPFTAITSALSWGYSAY